MKHFYLLRYRLRYNDINLKYKITLILSLFIIFVATISFYALHPIQKLQKILADKQLIVAAYKEIDDTVSTKSSENVILPISGTITSNYGYRIDPISGKSSKHTGIDISGIHHDNVRVIEDGIVTFAGSQNGYGNCIEIKHTTSTSSYYSFYAHLSQIKVSLNQHVNKGDIIALEGGDPRTDPNPGYSTGHHLHFEIRKLSGYGNDIDPTNYINKRY